MAKREAIAAVDFVNVFAPMALAGKSALEIGQALGVEGDAEKVAQFVSVKSSQLRARLVKAAEAAAVEQGLDADATEALVKAAAAKMPKLKSRGRKSDTASIVSALDAILASVNGESESESESE